jgi:hypothetical protein
MKATELMVGTWTPYSTEISEKDMEVFKKVFIGFTGVDYSPLCVSTQPVSGTNYRFFCNAKGVYPGALNCGAIVHIYEQLDGSVELKSIDFV